jgi:hypothetical protein
MRSLLDLSVLVVALLSLSTPARDGEARAVSPGQELVRVFVEFGGPPEAVARKSAPAGKLPD